MPIKVIDFFSGCGGTSCGFQSAGLIIALALDNDANAARTFGANFPLTPFIERDIRAISIEEVAPFCEVGVDEVILFSACAPCQPFSRQNKTRNDVDHRITLLAEFSRFIERLEPEYIFIENVPGIQNVTNDEGPFTDFIGLLEQLGYQYHFAVIASQSYGVPQQRKRLVLIACHHHAITIPQITHGRSADLAPYSTVGEWITDLPAIAAGETHPTVPNHRAAVLSEINLRRIAATPMNGGRRDLPLALQLECHTNGYVGHTDVYGRIRRHLPCGALTTRCISLSNGRYGHPEENRAISVREAACIQTFPRDFVFHGSLNSMARQIGNAVPPLLAQRFGEAFLNHFDAHAARE